MTHARNQHAAWWAWRTLPAALAVTVALGSEPAHAQLGFTEFALSDPDLNSSPETDFWIASAAPADVDGDGDLDLLIAGYFVVYFGSVEHRLTLYRNDGPANSTTWTLTPIALDASGLYFGAADLAWGDFDNDGDPDVTVAGSFAPMVLFRNDAGVLVRTSTVLPEYREDSGFSTLDLHSITWVDHDNDGDLDLLIPSVVGEFAYQPTQLWRNDGPGAGDAWTFTDSGIVLPAAPNAVSAWSDLEGDGDLDLLLANVSPYGDNFMNVYRNDAGTMQLASSDLAFIRYGTADWGDVDDDGDLDIVYAGNIDLPNQTGETIVRILFGDAQGGYTPFDVVHDFQSPTEPWLDFNAVTWADYDSDGDKDLLVSGEWLGDGEIFGRSLVYANSGGTFALASEPLPAPIAGNAGGAFTWFDVDSDGDLDYFVAGAYYVAGGNGLVEARAQLFRNDASAANSAPGAPGNVNATNTGPGSVTLSWTAPSDDATPSSSLTYDIELTTLGSGPAGERVIPEPGNVDANTSWTVRGLAPGAYTWSVRALDSAFNGSPRAIGSFTVASGVGSPFCSGDGTLATPCPCADPDTVPSPPAARGHGCANSFNLDGALLSASGTLQPDTLRIHVAVGGSYVGFGLLVKGSSQDNAGVAHADGIRCVDGQLVRFGGHNAGAHGDVPGLWSYPNAVQTMPISVLTAQVAGTTANYQLLYRNAVVGFCSPGTTNWSNAMSVRWPN